MSLAPPRGPQLGLSGWLQIGRVQAPASNQGSRPRPECLWPQGVGTSPDAWGGSQQAPPWTSEGWVRR